MGITAVKVRRILGHLTQPTIDAIVEVLTVVELVAKSPIHGSKSYPRDQLTR